MNIEIKFRGLNSTNEWEYGNLLKSEPNVNGEYFVNIAHPFAFDPNVRQVSIVPGTEGQFTGLKDRNGKDIYEGDLVRILYTDWPSNTDPDVDLEDYLISISHVGEVIYDAPSFGILFFKEDRYGERPIGSFNFGAHGRLEIIGNIFSNPTQLKQI